MTTLENSLYTHPVPLTEYVIPHPIQHTYGESDSPAESSRLYSARWRNMRKFGGTGDPTNGNAWSRKYNFVSHNIYRDFEKAKQVKRHSDVLSYPGTAIRQTRQQRYVDMVRGRANNASRYASKSDRGTNYNTSNLIHVNSDGDLLNNSEPPGVGIGPKAGPFSSIVPIVPLISADMTNPFPPIAPIAPIISSNTLNPFLQQSTLTQDGVPMPAPMLVDQPAPPVYGTPTKWNVLLAAPATNPDTVETVSQRYVFKLTGKTIATLENDANVQQLIMDSEDDGKQFDEKTKLFIDENMEYYVLRKDTGQPTWESPRWIRAYLTPEFAMSQFGRGRGDPIIPGIDLTVTKWIEAEDGVILIDFVGSMQFMYGNTQGTDGFNVVYHNA